MKPFGSSDSHWRGRARLVLEWVLVFLGALSAVGYFAFGDAGVALSRLAFDRAAFWSAPPPDPSIMIVQIDEASLNDLGRWPWPRTVHADLINALTDANVAQIGYDVVLIEPGEPAADAALATALKRSGRTYLPAYVASTGQAEDRLQKPLAMFAENARGIGHVNVVFDSDGQVRRARMVSQADNGAIRHMVAHIAARQGAGRGIPESFAIPFNRAGAFSMVPAASVLRGEVPKTLLENKIILVGATAQGLGDTLPVSGPAGSVMPGVEVQANMLNGLLHRARLTDVGAFWAAWVGWFAVALAMIIFWFVRPNYALLMSLALGGAVVVASALLLAAAQVWVTPVPTLAGLAIAYPAWSWRRLTTLNRHVEREVDALGLDLGDTSEDAGPRGGLDAVGNAAAGLRRLIGEMQGRRRFLQDVIESAPDAMFILDADERIVMANSAGRALVGGDTRVEGLSASQLIEAFARGADAGDDELELADGKTVLLKRGPIAATDQHGAGQIMRLVDISQRKAIEREREEFLEFLSHDIRAPLNNIIMAATSGVSSASDDSMGRIADLARASLALADGFVQHARLAAFTPELTLIDLPVIADEAIDRAYETAARRRVSIELRADDHLPPIHGDSWLLMRMLGNLIDNAIKYSPEGGRVVFTLDRVAACGTGECEQVRCMVIDEGPGISAGRAASLFERFGTNDPAHAHSTGLGLSFVKRAIDLLGGSISVESDATGTRFTMLFPAQSELGSDPAD